MMRYDKYCEKCGKNIATIHKYFFINGHGVEHDLCSVCANSDISIMKDFKESINRMNTIFENTFIDSNLFLNSSSQEYKPLKKQKYTENILNLFQNNLDTNQIKETELNDLQKKLKKAIEVEDYEGAAVIRDKLAALKKKK